MPDGKNEKEEQVMKKDIFKRFLFITVFILTNLYVSAESRKIHKESDGFEWVEVWEQRKYGAEDNNGTILVPIEYDIVAYHANNQYFRGRKGEAVAVFETDGSCVIGLERGYSDVFKHQPKNGSVYYIVYKQLEGMTTGGLCNSNGEEIISPERRYENITQQDGNGKIWYLVKSGKKNGACDEEGGEIIAPVYDGLSFYDGSFHAFDGKEWVKLDVGL